MNTLNQIYRPDLGLLSDLYQISMAYSYWKINTHNTEAVFSMFFRQLPFHGGYAVMCGLMQAIEYIENFKFSETDVDYLSTLVGNDGKSLFNSEFLIFLSNLKLSVNVDAIEEGRLVFSYEPLIRVQGSILECQLLETALLNIINFQTLIATKSARVKSAAGSDKVFEFGLRRAQGIDGALTASRAAYIGGCDGTSNILAGKVFGIPVSGTHAHSWVMSFPDELDSFMKFAQAMPNNAIFLVDTYNTVVGIGRAIEAGKWLRSQGRKFQGIRLDSGDLAFLSIEARKMLDAAGFDDCLILASNDLDEGLIEDLKRQGAEINVWGVGTKLVTAYDQPALGGVYKLSAIRNSGNRWIKKIKLSEQTSKTTIPGIQQVRRFKKNGHLICDMIYDIENPPDKDRMVIIDPLDATRRKKIPNSLDYEDLLMPVIVKGKRVMIERQINGIRDIGICERAQLHSTIKRFLNPHFYPVGLERNLYDIRAKMIMEYREDIANF